MKPLLLVDVDGVLCPFGGGPHAIDGHKPWNLDVSRVDHIPGYVYNPDWYVHISPENEHRLAKLSERFELVWCTGWEERANEVIAPLHNLPQLPVVEIKSYSAQIHWKYESIKEYVGDRPYAFIDDDIGMNGLTYASWRDTTIPTLWLKIQPSEGLGDIHMPQLEAFADRCALYSGNASEE
jgi:hypothetical protein